MLEVVTYRQLTPSTPGLPPRRPRRKYRYMEVNLQQKRRGLEVKVPDIEKTLGVVRFLEERRVRSRAQREHGGVPV